MKTRIKLLVAAISAFAIIATGTSVIAQSAQEKAAQDKATVEKVITVTSDGQENHIGWTGAGGGDNFVFVSTEMGFADKLVKGAPYSADAVTEMTQTLPDGNRIVNKNTASVARDSEGRTRREQTLRAIGPYATAGEAPKTLFIHDPVAGVSYVLDSNSKTARKLMMKVPSMAIAEKTAAARKEATVRASGDASADSSSTFDVKIARAGMPPPLGGPGFGQRVALGKESLGKESKKESLGNQTIEGVLCEGTRVTTTIAAGEIGNENPINIVSERWYSPELQVLVLDKHSDPRMGEHVYRLTNINRSEPAKSLFEVPADYTIKDSEGPGMRYQIEQRKRSPHQN